MEGCAIKQQSSASEMTLLREAGGVLQYRYGEMG